MTPNQILKSKNLNPQKPISQMTQEQALSSLTEALKEFEINIDFNKFSKEELEKLFSDYADAVFTYHPENEHQERAVFLKNEKMLKKYGLTDEEIWELDFV